MFAQAIRPPTVPPMTSRLRLAVMASHREDGAAGGRADAGRAVRAAGFEPRARVARSPAASSTSVPRARLRAPACSTSKRPSGSRRRPLQERRRLRGCFVTGTDTGVGKTVVAAAIVAALHARGVAGPRAEAGRSPVSTSLRTPIWPPDHELLARASPAGSPDDVSVLGYGPAVSPHLAAELAGEPIRTAKLERRSARRGGRRRRGAGRRGRRRAARPDRATATTSATSPATLGLPLVVAARPGLGTINHTLLTLEAARVRRRSASPASC